MSGPRLTFRSARPTPPAPRAPATRARAQVEREDHESKTRDVFIPSWARAELRFEPEYPAFEVALRKRLDATLRKPPKIVDDDEVDLMDDVIILTDLADGDASIAADVEQAADADALARYLTPLPGAGSAASAAFLEDIFTAEGEEAPASEEEEEAQLR